MKKLTMTFAKSIRYISKDPERTAYRSLNDTLIEFCTWRTRTAMINVIFKEGQRTSRLKDWKPIQLINDFEYNIC